MPENDAGHEVPEIEVSDAVELDDLAESTGEGSAPGEPAPEAPGQPRDPATGQFLPKDAKTEPEAAPAAPVPPQPSPTGTQTFQYQADGALRDVPGTTRIDAEGNVVFTAEALPWLKQELAAAYASRNSWRQQLAQAKAEGERLVKQAESRQVAADLVLQRLKQLAETEDENEVYEWVQGYRQNLPRLMLEAERAQLESERSGWQTEQQQREEQERVAQLVPMLTQGLDAITDRYMADPRFANLGITRDEMRQRLEQNADRVFFENPQTGEIMVNTNYVESEFSYVGDLVRRYNPLTQAAAANAQALQEAKVPPAVPAKGGEPASTKRAMPKFKSRAEFEEYMQSGAADRFVADRLAELSE